MTTDEIIDYYAGLLIIQYSALPNAQGTIKALVRMLLQNQIISQVRDGFDLDTAIGAQLNVLASYRGLSRTLFGAVAGSYMALVPYTDPSPNDYFGMPGYGDADPTWNFLQYHDLDSVAIQLTDEQLRRLIELRADIHSSTLGLGEIDGILYDTFGVYVTLVDNLNMSISFEHRSDDPDSDVLWSLTVLSNSLPVPAGVSYTTVEV